MLVILNSDVLYKNHFVHQHLPREWANFVDGCKSVGAEVVFPRTALYEVELRQKELYDAEIIAIDEAKRLLKRYHPDQADVRAEDLIKVADVAELFRSAGVRVHIEEAGLEDFQDAERRAALHLPPGPVRKLSAANEAEDSSDEMRDLVIWAVACRLARKNGGALLLSRDKVHSGALGAEEAAEVGLLRAKDFDDALGRLGAETDAGKIARNYLREAWKGMLEAGVPVLPDGYVQTISNPIFVQGEHGIASATFGFGSEIAKGKRFSANAEVTKIEAKTFELLLSDSKIEKSDVNTSNVSITVARDIEEPADDALERMRDLREILEQK